jgi:homoserine dehydrogenase
LQQAIRVGLIGFGTIGTGVVKLLQRNRARIRQRVGASIDLVRIADIDTRRQRGVRLRRGVLVADARAILDDPKIDIVIELMGGTRLARRFVLEALKSGKDVVTANKALLAHHGSEIFAAAERHQAEIGFEASVGGGIPIIRVLKESLGGDRHRGLYGIVNGTSNYILSRMSSGGGEFSEVLKEAQADGLAEADPSFDIEGVDAAHKLTLLVQLAFGCRLPFAKIPTEGIAAITQEDIAYANEFGYAIKHLAVAKHDGEHVEARVHPAMVPHGSPLADIDGALNAIVLDSQALETNMYVGLGAGMMPTATAVVGDLMEIARNRRDDCRGRVAPLGIPLRAQRRAQPLPADEVTGSYYLRLLVNDRPGVLSRTSGILAKAGISIASVIQRERRKRGGVTIVLRTHEAGEKSLRSAVRHIERLTFVRRKAAVIRIEENLF